MTLQSTVMSAFETLGDVQPAGPSHGDSLVLTPSAYPDAKGPKNVRLVVSIDHRGDLYELDFRAHVGDFCEDIDVVALRAWAAGHPLTGLGRVRVAGYDMGKTGVGEGRVDVVHTVLLTDPSAEVIAEIVNSLVDLWQRATRRFMQLRFNHRRALVRERRRQAAELANENSRQSHLDSARARVDGLVGLASVKTLVRQLVARQQFQEMCETAGLAPVTVSPHLVFTGNPGTGKTTVARIVADIYKGLGLLSKGQVVEVDRGGLVADYVGQTATKTLAVCEKARGGVLFIDEAYSLVRENGNDFGREAIDAIVKFMEDNRGAIAVIVAGYPDRMKTFLESNPGLASRFDLTVGFPDYTEIELMEILDGMMAEHEFVFGEGARHVAFATVRSFDRGDNFGNAREVRRLFETIVGRHAEVMTGVRRPDRDTLRTITVDAIPLPAKTDLEFVDLTELEQ